MGNEIAGSIRADLAALSNSAQSLASTVAPAAQLEGDTAQNAGLSFSQLMQDAVNKVNNDDVVAGQKAADVDSGKSDDLVGAMLSSQEAGLSFSMLMQVRNKVAGAVDDLLKLSL
ncbi:MAG TPA: flagellar hook-basal body complex protein FliE [Janthinobacterium sp.]|jgi:flagellar hook-basal body complex protein FliE|nr:flagellar hook-basal body complex protein FliE [Janthinobacterium sp.]